MFGEYLPRTQSRRHEHESGLPTTRNNTQLERRYAHKGNVRSMPPAVADVVPDGEGRPPGAVAPGDADALDDRHSPPVLRDRLPAHAATISLLGSNHAKQSIIARSNEDHPPKLQLVNWKARSCYHA